MKKLLLILPLALILLFAGAAAAMAAESAPAVAPRAEAAHAVLKAHIAGLYDDYAAYYTADEYRMMIDDYQGAFGGVGIYMLTVENEVVIKGVAPDTPAAESGISPGDVILAVDGRDIAGQDADQAVLLIRGEIGQPVTLTLRRAADDVIYTATLLREEIVAESVAGQNIAGAEDTAYIILYSFNEHTAEDFVEIYNQLRDERMISHLIIDLRSNSGGSFYAAINIANLFVPYGMDVVKESTSSGLQEYTSTSGQLFGIDLIVLQNAWTASASEVLTGALRDNARATVVGGASFGKGITQTVFAVGEGGYRYTRSRYYTPSGYDLHGRGIEPDIAIADPENIASEDYFSYDPALNPHLKAALEHIAAR